MDDVSELETRVQNDNPHSWEGETEISVGVINTSIEYEQVDGDKISQGDRHDSKCRRFGSMRLQDRIEPKFASAIIGNGGVGGVDRVDEVFERIVPRCQVNGAALCT